MVVNIDEKNLKQGLLGLVIALVEIIKEVLEGQALKRMESGRLAEEEVERLGQALMELDEALDNIKRDNEIEKTVKSVRDELDTLVDDSVNRIINPKEWVEIPREGIAE